VSFPVRDLIIDRRFETLQGPRRANVGREETGDSFAEPAPAATTVEFDAVLSVAAKNNFSTRTGVAECNHLSWGG
jgi:hypothetical protein